MVVDWSIATEKPYRDSTRSRQFSRPRAGWWEWTRGRCCGAASGRSCAGTPDPRRSAKCKNSNRDIRKHTLYGSRLDTQKRQKNNIQKCIFLKWETCMFWKLAGWLNSSPMVLKSVKKIFGISVQLQVFPFLLIKLLKVSNRIRDQDLDSAKSLNIDPPTLKNW